MCIIGISLRGVKLKKFKNIWGEIHCNTDFSYGANGLVVVLRALQSILATSTTIVNRDEANMRA